MNMIVIHIYNNNVIIFTLSLMSDCFHQYWAFLPKCTCFFDTIQIEAFSS